MGRATHFGMWPGMPKEQARSARPNTVAARASTT